MTAKRRELKSQAPYNSRSKRKKKGQKKNSRG